MFLLTAWREARVPGRPVPSARAIPQPTRRKELLSAPRTIFISGLLIRVLYITLAHTYRISPAEDHFKFGYEMARVARSLVTGHGYADPFSGHTGPTAWVPPLYPFLIAAVFKLTGIYTAASAWILLTLNSVFSAATAICIYQIADRCYNRKVALWSAWIWALYPASMQYATRSVWETSLTTFLFAAVLALAIKLRGIPSSEITTIGDRPNQDQHQTTNQWLLFGFLWGLIALSNSTLLLFLPVCGIWLLLNSSAKPAIGKAALAAVVFLAVIAPWMIRNYRAFHALIPFRSNFGAELYAGNNPAAYGFRYGVLIGLPAKDPQHQLYARLGELAYTHQRGELAKAWIRNHPAQFATLSLKRFYFFWASVPHPATKRWFSDAIRQIDYSFASIAALLGLALSLKRRTPAAGLFLSAFILLPLTYYFVTVEARFRHPLEPLIVILTVFLFQSATPRHARVC
jgi:4-amino-4-deoxy-L-arabinose transferase-like glycosyltransferase